MSISPPGAAYAQLAVEGEESGLGQGPRFLSAGYTGRSPVPMNYRPLEKAPVTSASSPPSGISPTFAIGGCRFRQGTEDLGQQIEGRAEDVQTMPAA